MNHRSLKVILALSLVRCAPDIEVGTGGQGAGAGGSDSTSAGGEGGAGATTGSTSGGASSGGAPTGGGGSSHSGGAGGQAICGDGATQQGEECDDGNLLDGDDCDATCKSQRALQICAGFDHACAILSGGVVKCWGNNARGQLGIGAADSDDRGDAPGEMGAALPAVNLSGVPAKEIACGTFHTCALLTNGDVRCWGGNETAQLGIESSTPSSSPVPAAPVKLGSGLTVDHIRAGTQHTCALFTNGSVKCWGFNLSGQCGQPSLGTYVGMSADSLGDALPPIDFGGAAVSDLSVGGLSTCAVIQGGVRCFGFNGHGELGLGSSSDFSEPGSGENPSSLANIPLGESAIQVASGAYYSCAVLPSQKVKCWGDNLHGELGINGVNRVGDDFGEVPQQALLAGNVTRVASGETHSCARFSNGDWKCWGHEAFGGLCGGTPVSGALGDDPNDMPARLEAIDFGSGVSAVEMDLGYVFGCALLSDHSIKCWGLNNSGQLGQGTTASLGDGDNELGDALPRVKLWNADW